MDEQKIQMMLAAVIDSDYPKFYSLFDEYMTAKVESAIRRRANDLGFFFQPGVTFDEDDCGESTLLKL